MEFIKVIFFALSSFFGTENNTIISEYTEVNINTNEKIITITHNNLISLIRNKNDSIKATKELLKLRNQEEKLIWLEEFETFSVKTIDFYNDEENEQLNAKIELHYNSEKDLKLFGIHYSYQEDSYSLINIEPWHIKTSVGNLDGNYWYFKDDISFTLSPIKKMPIQLKSYKKPLYDIWLDLKP